MKKQIDVNEEKLNALEMYLAQKGSSLEAELSKFTEHLFEKTVPQNVRDFIEMSGNRKPARKSRVAARADVPPQDEPVGGV